MTAQYHVFAKPPHKFDVRTSSSSPPNTPKSQKRTVPFRLYSVIVSHLKNHNPSSTPSSSSPTHASHGVDSQPNSHHTHLPHAIRHLSNNIRKSLYKWRRKQRGRRPRPPSARRPSTIPPPPPMRPAAGVAPGAAAVAAPPTPATSQASGLDFSRDPAARATS